MRHVIHISGGSSSSGDSGGICHQVAAMGCFCTFLVVLGGYVIHISGGTRGICRTQFWWHCSGEICVMHISGGSNEICTHFRWQWW